MKPLKEILYDALQLDASDIHLTVGLPPVYRIDGELRPLENEDILCDSDTLAAAKELRFEEAAYLRDKIKALEIVKK